MLPVLQVVLFLVKWTPLQVIRFHGPIVSCYWFSSGVLFLPDSFVPLPWGLAALLRRHGHP